MKQFAALFSNWGYAPFVAWGECLAPENGGMKRLQLIGSWNLNAFAGLPRERDNGSHRSLYFEKWDEAWRDVVLCYMGEDNGGPCEVLLDDERTARDILHKALVGFQLSIDGAMARAGLTEEQRQAVLRQTT